MQKTGGFKLAIEKRRGYYFEVSAVVISIFLLVLAVYAIVFATGVIATVFNNKAETPGQSANFNIDKAKKIEKIRNFTAGDFPQTSVTPSPVAPGASPSPAFSPIL